MLSGLLTIQYDVENKKEILLPYILQCGSTPISLYLAMIPANHSILKNAINNVRSKFENDPAKYISSQDVYGTTVESEIIFSGKGKKVTLYAYIHVYFSPLRKAEEMAKLHAVLEDKITALNLDFKAGKISVKDVVDRKFSAENKNCIKSCKDIQHDR